MRSAGLSVPHKPALRVALIGWGAIGRTVGRMLVDANVVIVAVGVRDTLAERAGVPASATVISDPSELAAFHPDVVVEAAGRDSVEPWARAALEMGADFICSSMSAFADSSILDALRKLAEQHGGQIHIQPGALGGIDALSGAMRMGVDEVEHRMVKPPKAWLGTPAEELCDLDAITDPTVFFTASAAEAASAFPKNANVAMTTALAGIGPERTMITLVADPTATTNRHEISAHGAFGHLDVVIANNPLPDNPKTSAMAALNLIRVIENRVTAIRI